MKITNTLLKQLSYLSIKDIYKILSAVINILLCGKRSAIGHRYVQNSKKALNLQS